MCVREKRVRGENLPFISSFPQMNSVAMVGPTRLQEAGIPSGSPILMAGSLVLGPFSASPGTLAGSRSRNGASGLQCPYGMLALSAAA